MAINVHYGTKDVEYQQEMNSQEMAFLPMSHELIVSKEQECVKESVRGN